MDLEVTFKFRGGSTPHPRVSLVWVGYSLLPISGSLVGCLW